MRLSELVPLLTRILADQGDMRVELQTTGGHLDRVEAEHFAVVDTIDHPNPEVTHSRFRADCLEWEGYKGMRMVAFTEPTQTRAMAMPRSTSLVIQRNP